MSGTLYKQYRDKVFTLARTMLIKHDEIATSINHELIYRFKDRYYPPPDNKKAWRYYLNLAGEYHQYDIDTLMEKYGVPYMTIKVPANDGSKEVPFTKELFNGPDADLSLANEMAIGSKLYNDMVIKYPELESLIIGIINPIDLNVAIQANNGEILYIDGFYKVIEDDEHFFVTRENKAYNVLIEEQEHNLILEIQRHIYDYIQHWVNAEYINGNDLYTLTSMGIFYSHLPNIIMNIRLGNCKTNYVHSFHIKQYLESFGQLGRYVDFIPIESALWLYRNVIYLEANRGKQETFHSILDNLWTPNNIPLNAYNIRHQLARMNKENLLPTGMLYKEVLNFKVRGISDDDRTNRDILNDQIPLARDNYYNLDEKDKKIQTILDWAGDDKLQTKVLESEMMELGDPLPFDLPTMLMNHWGYTAHKGDYTGTLHVTNSINGERIGITPLNAYLLTIYCLNYVVADIKLKNIPEVLFYDIPRTDFILDQPTDRRFEPKPDLDKAYGWVDQRRTRRRKVEEVLGTHKPKFKAGNSVTFKANVTEIFEERKRKYYAYSNTENFHERADLELVAHRCYWSGFKEQLATGNYQEWLRRIGIDFTNFQKEDYLNLALDLIAAATGFDKNEYSEKKWLQKAMVSIMKHFISYTVHLIEKFADGVVTYLGIPTVRYCHFQWTYNGMAPIKYSIVLDYWSKIKIRQPLHIHIPTVLPDFKINMVPNTRVDYDLNNCTVRTGKEIRKVGTYPLTCTILNANMFITKNKFDRLPRPPKNDKGMTRVVYHSVPLLTTEFDTVYAQMDGVRIHTEYHPVYDAFPPSPNKTIVNEEKVYHSLPSVITDIDSVNVTLNAVNIKAKYFKPYDPFPVAPNKDIINGKVTYVGSPYLVASSDTVGMNIADVFINTIEARLPLPPPPDKDIITGNFNHRGSPIGVITSDTATININGIDITTVKAKDPIPAPPEDSFAKESRYIVSEVFKLNFRDGLNANVSKFSLGMKSDGYSEELAEPVIDFTMSGFRSIRKVREELKEPTLNAPVIDFNISGFRSIRKVSEELTELTLNAPIIDFTMTGERSIRRIREEIRETGEDGDVVYKPGDANDDSSVTVGFDISVIPHE